MVNDGSGWLIQEAGGTVDVEVQPIFHCIPNAVFVFRHERANDTWLYPYRSSMPIFPGGLYPLT